MYTTIQAIYCLINPSSVALCNWTWINYATGQLGKCTNYIKVLKTHFPLLYCIIWTPLPNVAAL